MNIWLFQAGEPLPVKGKNERLLRTGMMCRELSKRKHNITWFTTTFDHFTKEQLYNEDKIIEIGPNCQMHLIWSPSYKKNISIARIINHKYMALKFRRVASKLEKPDLIYASFPTIDFAEEAIRYGKKHNIPVIIDIRDLWPDIFKHNLSGLKRIIASPYIKLMNYKTKKILKEAYAINSISQAMLDWGLEKGKRLKTNKDTYFYIGYDKVHRETENKCNEFINKNELNITFFGTINNQFNYDIIIELAKKVEKENLQFYICGDGPQFEMLEDKIKTNKISNIKLAGWINKDKLNYILSNSQIGIAPYKNTFDFQMSVSNKFCEYISYGLPIILTSEGYMAELLKQNNIGVASQDIDEIYKFILKIINNKEEYNKMSANAKELYEKNFVAEKIYSELVDYLEKIEEESK